MSLTTIDKQDIKKLIKEEIGESLISGPLKDAFTKLEEKIDFGIYRVEVLYEDTRAGIKTMSELLSNNLKVKDRVTDHEYRLTDIETVQPLMMKTLNLHSKQLKSQP